MSLEKSTVPKISLQKSTKHGLRSKSDHSQTNFSNDQAALDLNLRKSKNFPSFKFSKMESGKELELKKKRNFMLRNTCDETTLQGSFMKNEYAQILELQRQLSQILIRSLSEKKKSKILQELIKEIQRSLTEHQCAKNQVQLEEQCNQKFLEKLKKEVDMISAWKNKLDNENKVFLEEIFQQRRNRLNNSKIFYDFQKQIKQFELKYFVMLSRSQAMKKVAISSFEGEGKENGQIGRQGGESQQRQSEKTKKNKKFVSIKTRISIDEASIEEKECNERNSALTSLRFQTFKTIWSKHNRVNKKNSLNSAQILENEEQIKNLVTNCIFQIFESREEKTEFLMLKIKQIQGLLELKNVNLGQIANKIMQKKEKVEKENQQLFEQIERIEKQANELQETTKKNANTMNFMRQNRQYQTHKKWQLHKYNKVTQQIMGIFCQNFSKTPEKYQNIPKNPQKILEIIDQLLLPTEKSKQPKQPSNLWSFQPLLFKTQQYDTLFSSIQCTTPKEKILPLRKKTKKILY